MNYQHDFHAGNFADVLKHVVLIALIDALARKPKAFLYIDTHAGAGTYSLDLARARSPEFEHGVARLLPLTDPPALLARYLQLVADANTADAALAHYPGSPAIAAACLRDCDRLCLIESAAPAYARLKTRFATDRRAHTLHADGYVALAGLLPPAERRALVLIDPPYEAQLAELALIEAAVDRAHQRLASTVFAIWYPIKRRAELAPLRRWAGSGKFRHALDIELLVWPDNSPLRLNGCGMLLLNAPFDFDARLQPALDCLAAQLARHPQARATQSWLRRD